MWFSKLLVLIALYVSHYSEVNSFALPSYYEGIPEPTSLPDNEYRPPGLLREGDFVPEAPSLPPLNTEALPEYLRQLVNKDHPLSLDNERRDRINEMKSSIESVFGTPLPDVEHHDEDDISYEPHLPRTYGMILKGGQGKVWNDLWSNPEVAFRVGDEEHSVIEDTADQISEANDSKDSNIFISTPSYEEAEPSFTEEDDVSEPESKQEESDQFIKQAQRSYIIDILSDWTTSFADVIKEFIKEEVHTEILEEHENESAVLEESNISEPNVPLSTENTEILEEHENESALLEESNISEPNVPLGTEQNIEHSSEHHNIETSDVENEHAESLDNLEERPYSKHHNSESGTEIKAKNIYGNSVGAEKVTNVFMFLSEHIPDDVLEKLHWIISNHSSSLANNFEGSKIEELPSMPHDNALPIIPLFPEDHTSAPADESQNDDNLSNTPEEFPLENLSNEETSTEFAKETPSDQVYIEEIPSETLFEQPSENDSSENIPDIGLPSEELPAEGLPGDDISSENISETPKPVDELSPDEFLGASNDSLPQTLPEELPVAELPKEDFTGEEITDGEIQSENLSAESHNQELGVVEEPVEEELPQELSTEEIPSETLPGQSSVAEPPTESYAGENIPDDQLPSEELPAADILSENIPEIKPVDESSPEEPPSDLIVSDDSLPETLAENLPAAEIIAEDSHVEETLATDELPQPDESPIDERKDIVETEVGSVPPVSEIGLEANNEELLASESFPEDLPIQEAINEDLEADEPPAGEMIVEPTDEEVISGIEGNVPETSSADIEY